MTKLRYLIIPIGVILFVVGAFFANQADLAAMQNNSSSSVVGLAAMKRTAENSLTYQKALENGKPTLVEFYADWCTTCQAMAPLIENFAYSYEEKMNFVTVNIDEPQQQGLIKEYEVTGVPQFTFINSQQEVVRTLVGRVPESIMAEQLSLTIDS